MYSMHPFGGLESHPYGGSMGLLPQINTGASQAAFKPMQLNQAALKATYNNMRKLNAMVPRYNLIQQPLMGAGAESSSFFEEYKTPLLIGGAVAVIGIAALIMRGRR